MFKKVGLIISLSLLGFVTSFFAGAYADGSSDAGSGSVLDLVVQDELPVYARPTSPSRQISRLIPGDKVVISPLQYRGFRKVMVIYKGRSVAGYIPSRLLKKSHIVSRKSNFDHDFDEEESSRFRAYHSSYSMGVCFVGSYLNQGEGSFELSDGSKYKTTNFISQTYFLSLFADIPLHSNWGLRSYLNRRTTHFKGQAIQQNSLSPSPVNPTVEKKQSLWGAGLILQYYTDRGSWWWVGGGLELAQGDRLELTLNQVQAPTTQENLPFFAMFYGVLGLNLRLLGTENFYIVPDLRAGVIGTTKPITSYLESWLGIAYLF